VLSPAAAETFDSIYIAYMLCLCVDLFYFSTISHGSAILCALSRWLGTFESSSPNLFFFFFFSFYLFLFIFPSVVSESLCESGDSTVDNRIKRSGAVRQRRASQPQQEK
jgi:hypothetical protein